METPEPPEPSPDVDRDLAALEQAERKLAELERQLDSLETDEALGEPGR